MNSHTSPKLKLHKNGSLFSKIALGFWRLHEWDMNLTQLTELIEGALELGVTTFDHADIYGSYGNEERFGKVLRANPDLRSKMELVSKCGICLTTENRPHHIVQHYNTTSEYIRKSVERSLHNLESDYLDLILIHRPDPLMDAGKMADTFSKLIEEKKILNVGVSNFSPSQFELFQSKLDHPLVTNQVECSLLHLDPIYDGTFDQAQKNNFSPMIWSPFAGGELFTGQSQKAVRVRGLCHKLSKKYSASIDQIALAWLFQLPCKAEAIAGTGKLDRLKSAVESTSLLLERQDWYRLLEASNGNPVP